MILGRITVVGLDEGPLGEEVERLLADAALVAGGRRHLEMLGVEEGRAVVLKGDLSGALARIEGIEGPVVVLASGDPGFFGIVRLLGARFGRENLRVLPGSSSISVAFARAGLSWDDAVTVSAHGRDPRRAVNVCRAHPKAAVLTSPDFGPAELAEALDGLGRSFVLSRLGPGPGDLIWDIGAGSGSVAIECARLGAAAIAVERDPESCARIRRNAKHH